MSATPVRDKVSALLTLAGGGTNKAAAEAAGVSPGTVAGWKRKPEFAAALADLQAAVGRRPFDAAAVMAAAEAAERRLSSGSAMRVEGGRWHVTVEIPAGASARRVERLTARAIARGMRAVREQEGGR
ncbi:hypothetical protein ACFZCL_10300 [Streptomyces sp. NPDC008159]|uniref:hypothetical protein n=1 Tax=Streptomyces sp. NPDC008159 TaxID=3364817 RepID=UPI0036EC8A78